MANDDKIDRDELAKACTEDRNLALFMYGKLVAQQDTLLKAARTVIRGYQENDAVHVDAQATALLAKLNEVLK